MRRLRPLLVVAAAVLAPTIVLADETTVRLVEFDTAVTPISARRIVQSIDDAEAAGDDLVLIVLDTPGGLVDSMESIVKRMLAARVPIAVWVGPAGAKAASAGFFILIAADVAAMAPGTRAGAASVVYGSGENREDDVLLKKMNEDKAALIRSIADRRGRNPEACQAAVFGAKSYEEQVALEKGLIDIVAASRDALLQQLDGREVTLFDGSTTTLHTANPTIVETEFGFRHGFMELLASPAVAAILLMIGGLALYVEFTNPGAILPGVVGALCLLLFAISAQMLPVSAIGVLLIALALVMFLLEIKVVSYGMLSLGGTVSLVIGAMMLIDGPIPELRVPPSVVLPTALAVATLCIVAMRLAVRAHRARITTGEEGLADAIGRVTQSLDPEGKVFVHGELWNAASAGGALPVGTEVRVVRVDGLRLTVESVGGREDPSSGGGSS